MLKTQNPKEYDLEKRTLMFAKRCREFIKIIPKSIANFEDSKQLIKSSGSIHANFIEANEALSKKDFYHRVKISRKEAKESRSWIWLIDVGDNANMKKEQKELIQEAIELMKIFGSIVSKGK